MKGQYLYHHMHMPTCYISRHCHQFGMNAFLFCLFRQYKFFFVFYTTAYFGHPNGACFRVKTHSFRLKSQIFRLKTQFSSEEAVFVWRHTVFVWRHTVFIWRHTVFVWNNAFSTTQFIFDRSFWYFFDNDPWQRLNDNLWFLKVISLSVSKQEAQKGA